LANKAEIKSLPDIAVTIAPEVMKIIMTLTRPQCNGEREGIIKNLVLHLEEQELGLHHEPEIQVHIDLHARS